MGKIASPAFSPITLDRNSYVPYYRQIADQVRAVIQSRGLVAGATIWSEGELAQQLGISKMTVRQALQTLRRDGLLVVEKGKRPRVGPGRPQKDFQELRGFTEEMARRGMQVSSKLLAIEHVRPEREVRAALALKPAERVYRVRRLRFADGELVGLETAVLPADLFPGLDKQGFEKQSLYSVLEGVYDIKLGRSMEEIEAVAARGETAKMLHVPSGFPLFSMKRTVFSADDRPVEYGHSLFRGDRYTATVISHRKS